ncbi:RagB/SusD family nutrient uptake outer membrane protein [Chryseobacterium sp. Marseille-Q3244]|uniref:RagB/SusD family nutrient uptake outer membrane protein n=1 Tax=Chryseobacterium sp. Marseille-Q3244 TaxID=2758092 RepID=UPI002025ABA7|nr:RagB/SusD family nutrient uptake outer membrane protein [Chryseobacterium sp. Marseille-Q3244]
MKKINFIVIIYILCVLSGCSKEWLEKKQDIKLIVPTELNDLDMLLNNPSFLNDGRGASEMSSDDATYSTEQFNALPRDFLRNLATWQVSEFIQYGTVNQDEWDISYNQIQICNVVLAALEKISRTNENANLYDRIKGTALYHRSRQFLNLAMTFCKYYEQSTAKTDLGIPLKISDDIDENIFRASLEDTYRKIVFDLKLSCSLLPLQKVSLTHIAKGGAYALLARTYLFMDQYEEARMAADSSYKYHSFIEDYNSINSSPSRPLNIQSKEIHIPLEPRIAVSYATTGRIDSILYGTYDKNDLRKNLFFKLESDGKYSFRGHYRSALFSGTTTPEVLLISAECNARLGNIAIAMQKLNLILEKRFKKGTYVSLQASTKDESLNIILLERRKELLTRCLRWQDLKRLNRDPQYTKTLKRSIGLQNYLLPPNDPRYVLPIPQYIINFNGLEQNKY